VDSSSQPESGSCNAVVADCSSIPGKGMCLTPGAAGSKTCFWLSNASIATYGGNCKDKADSNLQCSDVADISECDDDSLGGTTLKGKCAEYGGSCKTKCEKLEDSETCAASDIRSGDCFEVKDENGNFKECINRVCWVKEFGREWTSCVLCIYLFLIIYSM
jgi:hypothetical protein